MCSNALIFLIDRFCSFHLFAEFSYLLTLLVKEVKKNMHRKSIKKNKKNLKIYFHRDTNNRKQKLF